MNKIVEEVANELRMDEWQVVTESYVEGIVVARLTDPKGHPVKIVLTLSDSEAVVSVAGQYARIPDPDTTLLYVTVREMACVEIATQPRKERSVPERLIIPRNILISPKHHPQDTITGSFGTDAQGVLVVNLDIHDHTGRRHITHLGRKDLFEFAGSTWRIERVYDPHRGHLVVDIIRVDWSTREFRRILEQQRQRSRQT